MAAGGAQVSGQVSSISTFPTALQEDIDMRDHKRWHTLWASRKAQLLARKKERVQQHMAEIERRQEEAKADLRMFGPSRLNRGP